MIRALVPLLLAVAIGVLVTPVISVALFLFDANQDNSMVAAIIDIAQNLVEPFRGIFTLDEPQLSDAVAWGLASVVYLVIASTLSTILKRGH